MKAIVALTPEEHTIYSGIYRNLKEKTDGLTKQSIFVDFNRQSGYAHYKFSGRITETLVDVLGRMPTPVEIIMLVDNGFSHFGASCNLRPDGTFDGRVNTD